MTILIIEDEPIIAEVLQRLLRELGGQFQVAENWAIAEAMLRSTPAIELITLDLILPDTMSAEETLSKVSLIKTLHPNVIIIVLTGVNDPTLEYKSKAANADVFLPKARMMQELLSTVRDAFGKKNAGFERNMECLDKLTQLNG